MLTARKQPAIIEHAVPAYVPEARGQITHYLCFDHPPVKGLAVVSEEIPCLSLGQAQRFERSNKLIGMRNVRILTWEEKHGLAVAGGGQ